MPRTESRVEEGGYQSGFLEGDEVQFVRWIRGFGMIDGSLGVAEM